MGFSGISPWSLLLILLIVLLLFGTKRLRNIGQDLGSALKGFKKGMSDVTEVVEVEHKATTDDNAAKSDSTATEDEEFKEK